MTMLDLYNGISNLEDATEIKLIVKKAVLEELAGDEFTVKPHVKKDETKTKINSEFYKQVKTVEKKENRKLTSDEKKKLKDEITTKFSK